MWVYGRVWLLRVLRVVCAYAQRGIDALDPPPPPLPLGAIQEAAIQVVTVVEGRRSGSRHAGLVKNLMATRMLREMFPSVSVRVLKLAIEQTVSDGHV